MPKIISQAELLDKALDGELSLLEAMEPNDIWFVEKEDHLLSPTWT